MQQSRSTPRFVQSAASFAARMCTALLLAACSSGGDPAGPNTVAPTITIGSTTIELRGVGTEKTITVSVTPAGSAVTWSSATPSVATVTGNGNSATVRAVSAGTAQIKATVTSGGNSAEATATATVVPIVKSVVLSATGGNTMTVGETRQITATVNADAGAEQALTWSTTDASRATVSSTGLVTALTAGDVTITATSTAFNTVKGQLAFTINALPVVTSVAVSPENTDVLVGATRPFTAAVVADAPLSSDVTWSTSSASIATIDNAGVATGVAPGTVTITATSVADNTKQGTATLEVRTPAVSAISVALPATLREGQSIQATPTITADAGANTALEWASSNTAVAAVDNTGMVTAVAPGTAQITATSVAFPSVSGSAPLQVTVYSGFTSWVSSRVGVIGNQITDGVANGAVGLSDNRSLASWREVFEGPFPEKAWNVVVGNGTVTDVGTGVPALNYLSSADGNTAYGEAGDKVFRFNGSNWQELSSHPPGDIRGVEALGSGGAVALTRQNNGSLYRWDGTSWTLLSTLPASINFGTLRVFGENNIAVIFAGPGPCALRVWNGTTWTTVSWPQGVSVAYCGLHSGTAIDNLYLRLDSQATRVFHWNGSSWTILQGGISSDDPLQNHIVCGSEVFVQTNTGRVYRWSGSAFVRLGNDSELIGEHHSIGTSRTLFCGRDNLPRVAHVMGLLQRWTGSAWVTETFAPAFRVLAVASPTVAWAASGGAGIYRYNGTSWTRAYAAVETTRRRATSFAAFPDGKLVSVFSSISWFHEATLGFNQPNEALRFDGTGWIRDDDASLATLNGVWGTSYTNTFGVTGAGTIMRFNGTTWQQVHSVGQPLYIVDGVGTDYALAVGKDMVTVRWNGTTWAQVGGVHGAGVPVQSLAVVAKDVAFARSFTKIYRFNGTTWTETMTGLPPNLTPYDVFGTAPNDVYAIYGDSDATQRELYRFNGTQWTQVSSFVTDMYAYAYVGDAIPGLAMVMGSEGLLMTGTEPQASAMFRRR